MKKIVYIVMVLTFLFSSYFAIKLYSDYDYYTCFVSNKNQSVHIENKDNRLTSKDYLKAIMEDADKESISVKRLVYTPVNNGNNTKIVYYIYNSKTDKNKFFDNLPLCWGRFVSKSDEKYAFLSNKSTGSSSQIGRINIFDNTKEVEIRNLTDMENHIYGTDYVLSTDSKEKANNFASNLEELGLLCTVNSSSSIDPMQFDFLFYLVYVPLILCLYILCSVAFLYYLINRFKEFAVQKMFGSFNKDIIHSVILKDVIPIISYSLIASIVITLIFLFFFNTFTKVLQFILMWLIIQIFVAGFALLTFFIVCQVVKSCKTSESLKNKKPLKLVKGLNYGVKAVFSVTAVILLTISIQNINLIQKENGNFSKWIQTQHYAVVAMTVDDSVMENPQKEYESNEKVRGFFGELDKNGAMLLSPSSYYNDNNANNIKEYDRFPAYSPWKYSVSINNNYLKLNPIFDLSGKPVEVINDGSADTTLLVPLKYKPNEQDIIKLYQEYISVSYFGAQDRYQFNCGKDIGYDIDAKGATMKHHDPLKIHIIYVKDGQKYFTYDADVCKKQNNEITDPIAMIVTSKSCDSYSYPSFICRNEMRAFVDDYNNPSASLTNIISKENLQDNVVAIISLYDKFGEHIYNVKMQIALELIIMLIALIIVFAIVIFSANIYLEQSKLIHAVKSINGYSFLDRHKFYLLTTAFFWLLIFVVMLGLCATKILPFSIVTLIILGLLIIDEALSIFIISIKESNKQKDILKGG